MPCHWRFSCTTDFITMYWPPLGLCPCCTQDPRLAHSRSRLSLVAPLPRRELSPRVVLLFAQRAHRDLPRHASLIFREGVAPRLDPILPRSPGSDHTVTAGLRCGEASAGTLLHSSCSDGLAPACSARAFDSRATCFVPGSRGPPAAAFARHSLRFTWI